MTRRVHFPWRRAKLSWRRLAHDDGHVEPWSQVGPKGPVFEIEQISNAAANAAIFLRGKCRKRQVSGAMSMVSLCIFLITGAQNRHKLKLPFCSF